MLQVARLAPNLLHEAVEPLARFLLGTLDDDGGARDRAGRSDLYYTAFTLEALKALQVAAPVERVGAYLDGFGEGDELDLVHLSCLVRSWASIGREPEAPLAERVLTHVERHRSGDGGYAARPGSSDGTLYHVFLALGVYQDLGRPLPDAAGVARCLDRLRTADGAYANALDLAWGTTPSTAAAVAVSRQLGLTVPPEVGPWLAARAHARGGFLAMPDAPIPDLLSTATALHALAGLEHPFDGFKEACIDFVDTLWTGQAFCGNWAEDDQDSEYAFYALLALGHLSL